MAKSPRGKNPRQSKFGNRWTKAHGFNFQSEWEAERWGMLVRMHERGEIILLDRQKTFDLHGPNGAKLTSYTADFVYIRDGKRVIEDAKGFVTDEYALKRAWMLDEYGIEIKETYKKRPSTW